MAETQMSNTYLFILCQPYSGSTILWSLLRTSENVSAFPTEGQLLPETKAIMEPDAWRPEKTIPWEEIIPIWESYWDLNKPILLEKSPPHLIRVDQLAAHFSPAYFLILVRNPYALCEGIIRRENFEAEKVARTVARRLLLQKEHSKNFKHTLCLTYEELADNPKKAAAKIEAFMPQLGKLDYQQKFGAHAIDGTIRRKIVNLNQKKIDNLSPKQLAKINEIFKKKYNALESWGYELYTPPKYHFFIYSFNKIKLFFQRIRAYTTEGTKRFVMKKIIKPDHS